MSVDRREVERIAALARLRLEPEEAERLRDDMNRILGHADRLRDALAGEESGRAGIPDDPAAADGARAEESSTRALPEEAGALAPAVESGARAAAEESGFRAEGDDAPDPLRTGPEAFAPAMEHGFFLVPPPRGVTVGEGEG